MLESIVAISIKIIGVMVAVPIMILLLLLACVGIAFIVALIVELVKQIREWLQEDD